MLSERIRVDAGVGGRRGGPFRGARAPAPARLPALVREQLHMRGVRGRRWPTTSAARSKYLYVAVAGSLVLYGLAGLL
jgi:hypothetical protein